MLDILESLSGVRINTIEEWEKYRRPELMLLLENYVYGVRPNTKPDKLVFNLVRNERNWKNSNAIYKEIDICMNEHHFPLYVFIPETAKFPSPTFLTIMNEKRSLAYDFNVTLDYDHLPIREIIRRGYALAVMPTNAVSPDWYFKSEFKKGVFRALQPNVHERTERSWATLSAWALGASCVMDYLETDIDIDHKNVAVIGHSRDGKAALWAGATDQRIKLVISNSSGCGGAAYTRGKKGEHLKNINVSDWFCDNYKRYNEREDLLPVDQHMLLATIAPRPLYIKSDDLDEWADPDAELLSAKLATKVYELYNLPGLIVNEEIVVGKPYHDGMIAYHRAPGEHNITRFDWGLYMNFADQHLKARYL